MSYNQKRIPAASRPGGKAKQSTKPQLPLEGSAAASRNESILTSSNFGIDSPGHKVPGSSRRTNIKTRSSRSSISPPSSRPAALESYRSPSSNSSRIPLPSGTSSEDVPGTGRTRKVLRRKASSVEQYALSLGRQSHKSPANDVEEVKSDTVSATTARVLAPKVTAKRPPAELPPALIPELKALAAASVSNSTVAPKHHVPLVVGSPSSTQYSGSTGPWSVSRNTTPCTSISSCSPGIVQPSGPKETPRLRKTQKPLTPTPPPRTSSIKPTSHRSASASKQAADKGLLDSKADVRPRRPTREGTPDLEVKLTPVIQSSLSPQSLRGYKRRNSLGARSLGLQVKGIDLAKPAKADHHDHSYSDIQPPQSFLPAERIGSPYSSRLPVTTRTPDPPTQLYVADGSGDPASEQSSHGKLSSRRLSIFSRQSKTSRSREDASTEEKRDVRKGPAAGTGHEVYGKYATRGRKYSAGSAQNSRDQSSSTTSLRSLGRRNSQGSAGSEIDDLVLQRQTPVIITGGGGRELFRDTNSLRSDSSLELTKQLTPETPGSTPSTFSSAALHRPTVSKAFTAPAYAVPEATPLNLSSTSQSSFDDDGDLSRHRKATPSAAEQQRASKSRRKLKWNLFRRKTSSEPIGKREGQASERMEVAVAPVVVEKPLPFYAMMDSEYENDEGNDLQDLLDQVHQESPSFDAEPTSEAYGLGLRQQSLLLPAMPALTYGDSRQAQPQSPVVYQKHQVEPIGPFEGASTQAGGYKLNRLPQIGRIPRVVYQRDRENTSARKYTPATASFSRPFRRGVPTDIPKEIIKWTDPSRYSTEEEIWDEYDDLLDHVMSPISASTSNTRFPSPQEQS